MLSKPTPYLLTVTRALLSHVTKNYTSCFFVDTETLINFSGNKPHPEKLNRLRESICANEQELHLPLPILVINCLHSTAVLIEGNNRLALFREMKKRWFPVVVRIEDYNTPLKVGLKRFPVPRDLDGEVGWRRKQEWVDNVGRVLTVVFGLDILDLNNYEYNEECDF